MTRINLLRHWFNSTGIRISNLQHSESINCIQAWPVYNLREISDASISEHVPHQALSSDLASRSLVSRTLGPMIMEVYGQKLKSPQGNQEKEEKKATSPINLNEYDQCAWKIVHVVTKVTQAIPKAMPEHGCVM